MSNPTNPNNQSTEIDLSHVSAKVKGYVTRTNDSFFDAILFVKRYIIIIAILVIGGAVLGYFMDKGPKTYGNKILVKPNFESVDYLYQTVSDINSKIKQRDSAFFQQIGIKDPGSLAKIKIEPVVDIYNFIDEPQVGDNMDERRFQVFKLMVESGDMEEILKDSVTSKNYKNHMIHITSKGKISRAGVVDPLMAYLNSNPYFKQMKEEYVNNLNLKIQGNDSIMKQLDRVVSHYTDGAKKGNPNLIYYNDNSQLAEAMKLKEKLLKEQGKLRIDRVNYTDIIKSSSITLNEKSKGSIMGKMKILIPVVLFILFVCIMMFRSYYRSQVEKRKLQNT